MIHPAILMLVILLPLWILLRRNFISGLCYGIVVLVACTHLIRIETPGALPELTIHRLVILSLVFFWIRGPYQSMRIRDVPLFRHIQAWAFITLISLIGSADHGLSIKRYLDYVFEFFLLYFILATSIKSSEDGLRVLTSACVGVSIVAGFAIMEKYLQFNVVDRLVPILDGEAFEPGHIRATYRHRILLGTGMAMGWPLAFYFSQNAKTARRRWIAWLAVLAMLSACYFARSRGPWLAAALAGLFLFLFGSALVRKRLAVIACLAGVLFLVRPGVFETISGLAEATLDADSFKGGTFRYRLELWYVALDAISQSPWRFLFGYGPGTGAEQSLDWTLSYRDKDFEISSWDNDLAYALYQYGTAGLIVTLLLYGVISTRLLAQARQSVGANRDLFICLAASSLVLFFMMSNVMIFTRQLYYLLWTVTAIGFVMAREQHAIQGVEMEEAGESTENYAAMSPSRFPAA